MYTPLSKNRIIEYLEKIKKYIQITENAIQENISDINPIKIFLWSLHERERLTCQILMEPEVGNYNEWFALGYLIEYSYKLINDNRKEEELLQIFHSLIDKKNVVIEDNELDTLMFMTKTLFSNFNELHLIQSNKATMNLYGPFQDQLAFLENGLVFKENAARMTLEVTKHH